MGFVFAIHFGVDRARNHEVDPRIEENNAYSQTQASQAQSE